MKNTAAPYTNREGITLHFDNCTTKAEHINCIQEWIKDSKTDLAVSGDPLTSTDYAYFQGQIAAWELTLELIAGTILEEQTTEWTIDEGKPKSPPMHCPKCSKTYWNGVRNARNETMCINCYDAMPDDQQEAFFKLISD